LSFVMASVFLFAGQAHAFQQKVTPLDGLSGDKFGKKVAMYGDYAVVTSPYVDDYGSNSGAAYVYHWDGSIWTELQKLAPTELSDHDYFGLSVAMTDRYIAIGAPGDDTLDKNVGAVYVYVFDNRHESWTRYTKIVPQDFVNDSRYEAQDPFVISELESFGTSVSILDNDLFVGAPTEDSASINAGVVYRYFFDGTSWQYIQKIVAYDASFGNKFGNSLASNGKYTVVGSKYSDDYGSNSGAAYILSGNVKSWHQIYKIVPEDCSAGDLFGYDVSIYGDFVAVGSLLDDDKGIDSGSAYVFQKNDNEEWLEFQKITPKDGLSEDSFGSSIGIFGNRLVVGAKGVDDQGIASGAMYKYYFTGYNWSQEEKVTAYDGQASDIFGSDVTVYESTFLIGANGDDDMGSNAGAAYFIYAQVFSDEFELKEASMKDPLNFYGRAVDISGDFAAVGEYNYVTNAQGQVFIYNWDGQDWKLHQILRDLDGSNSDGFGYSVDFGGDYLIIGAPDDSSLGNNDNGVAYIYKLKDNIWMLDQKLYIDQSQGATKYFGGSVSIDGQHAVVGCYLCSNSGVGYENSGSAYVFEKTDNGWSLMQKLEPVDSEINKQLNFGQDVSVSGGNIVVSAPLDFDGEGSVYTYYLENYTWIKNSYLVNSFNTYLGADEFGCSIALQDNKLFVNAHGNNNTTIIYYYKFDNKHWNLLQDISENGSNNVSNMGSISGSQLDFDGDKLVSGTPAGVSSGNLSSVGRAYVYKLLNDQLVPFAELLNSNPKQNQMFGFATGISGDRVISGVGQRYNGGGSYGTAYIFGLSFQN